MKEYCVLKKLFQNTQKGYNLQSFKSFDSKTLQPSMSKRGSEEFLISPETEVVFKKLDIKTTPMKMDMTNVDSEKVIKEIEKTAPEWFLHAFSHLNSELRAIREDLSGIQTFKHEVKDKLENHEKKIADLESKTEKQESTLKKLQNQVAKMETYTADNKIYF